MSIPLRALLFVAGSTISSLCYALTVRAGLGLGPLFVAQDGVSRTLGMSLGSAVMVVGVGLVGLAVLLRSWPRPGTLILLFLSGATLNALLPRIPTIHGWPTQLVVVILATWIMALGGAMVIRASLGCAAYDAVMLGLHRLLRQPLAPVRIGMELSMLAIGWLLGGALGVGTVITGVLVGPAIHHWLKVLRFQPTAQPQRISRRVPVAQPTQ